MDLPFGVKDLRGIFQPFVTGFLRMSLLHCQKQGSEISQINQILKYHVATVQVSKKLPLR